MLIRIILGVAIIALVQFLFVNRTLNLLKQLFPDNYNKIKKGLLCAVILLNGFPLVILMALIYSLVSESSFSLPENAIFDYLFVYPFWIFIILSVQLDLLYLLVDALRILLKSFYKKPHIDTRILSSKIKFGLLLFFLLYIPIRIIYDYHFIDISQVKYIKSNLPQALDDFNIAFISDVQADRYTDEKRLMNFVANVNEQNPDLILIAGDMITGSPDFINTSARIMSELNAKYGIYSCVGDHDNWAYRNDTKRSLKEIQKAFIDVGIPILDNTNIFIPVDTAKLFITALTNTYVERIEEKMIDSLVNGNEADIKILLTHQPRTHLMEKASEADYDMYLCGHTHGGQITFLFPFYFLSPTLLETKYVRGLFKFDNMFVYVTRGLGMSIAPLRYNSTPEITVITLSKE